MKRLRVVVPGVMALMFGAQLASSAPASAVLVLKAGGQVAPVGTPALGVLRFGPCGTFESNGQLTVNGSRVDVAKFTSTTEAIGGCGEGGPIISGSVKASKLRESGRFTVGANLTYTTTVPEECSYALKMLHGNFAIPGVTQATVSGKAKRTGTSKASCPETTHVTGVEASLYDLNTNELLEAQR